MAKSSAAALLLFLVWMSSSGGDNVVMGQNLGVKVDLCNIIKLGWSGGICTSIQQCCNKEAVCVLNFCCLKPGKACKDSDECCYNFAVLRGSSGGHNGICQSGKCCAPFGAGCTRDDDCCDKDRKCRGDGHTRGSYCA